jgi:hypothetical protein
MLIELADKKLKLDTITLKIALFIIISFGLLEKILAVAQGIIIKAVIRKTPVTFTANAISKDNKIINR